MTTTTEVLAEINATLAGFGQFRKPVNHRKHVDFLMAHHGLSEAAAERMAMDRYRRLPHELERWGED